MDPQPKQLLQIRFEILQRGWLSLEDANQIAVSCRHGRQVWWAWVRRLAARRLRELQQEPLDA